MSITSRSLSPVRPIAGVPDPLIQWSMSHINLDVSVGTKKSTCPEHDSSSLFQPHPLQTHSPCSLSVMIYNSLLGFNPDSSVPCFYIHFPSSHFHWTTSVQATKFPCLDSPLSFLIVLTPASIPCKPRSTLRPESTYFPAHLIMFFSPLQAVNVFLKLSGSNANSVTWLTIVCLFLWLLNSLQPLLPINPASTPIKFFHRAQLPLTLEELPMLPLLPGALLPASSPSKLFFSL